MTVLEIPDLVRRKAVAEGMGAWVDGLPALVDGLANEWSLRPGRVLTGGSEALVIEATLADGAPAVLKLLMPHSQAAAAHEIRALELAGGRGCATLFRSDASRGAMLMERLGQPLERLEASAERRLAVLVGLAREMWRPAAGAGVPSGREKAAWLAEFIETEWGRLGWPCSKRAMLHARDATLRRAADHDDIRAVLTHGDIHAMNALASPDGGYKLVDPDGLLAEPEYDIGVILRQLPPGRLEIEAARIAAEASLNATAIVEWATAERLSTALVCKSVGYEPLGSELIEAAEAAAP